MMGYNVFVFLGGGNCFLYKFSWGEVLFGQ